MNKILNIGFIVLLIFSFQIGAEEKYTAYVDPFIGTGGHGHTYPGAALPFGMVQLSPDTRLTGWDGCSGYHYSDHVVYGFSHTHLSGTGVSDYGDILLMPTVGPVQWQRGTVEDPRSGYCSTFKHGSESAKPGYYEVRLEDYGIDAELTVTPRTGVHRYRFPASKEANIIIDLTHRDTVIDAGLSVVNDREIQGFRRSSAWAKDQHVYFVARFSKPFYRCLFFNHEGHEGLEGKKIKAVPRFQTKAGEEITVKVGISAVSMEGARGNLEAEAGGLSFDQIKKAARRKWNRALKKIRVSGGSTAQKRVFYTALYHALLNPNLYMDVDGRYRGRDLKVHRAKGFTYYTVFSLWDTYRTAHPLFTLIEPERTDDFIRTFIAQYEQGGLLPVWELAANETFCMIGYHAVPVIVDAYIKGLRGYDIEKAYEAIKHSASRDHFGLKHYREQGYIPAGEEAESVSKTLEYAYDDWCIAQMAGAMNKAEDYEYYLRRAQYYKNLFDPSSGFMRARMQGLWFTPFDPAEVNFNYTEANSWQYSFYVPQDVSGLMSLMGGKEGFIRQLDNLFSADSDTTGREQADITGLIGQYAHGNEPSHHMAYLYTYASQPWKTQQRAREIMDTLYTDKPDGLCGNEDCGQMSAWYVMSALGFYPVTPGSDIYVIGTPLFEEVSISVGNGKEFTVKAPKASAENTYIQSAALNGRPWTSSWIRHKDIAAGGELEFDMGPRPNTEWGSAQENVPVSQIVEHPVTAVPYVEKGLRTFKGSTPVVLGVVTPGAHIYYTLDGSTPSSQSRRYRKPFTLKESAVLKAIAIKQDQPSSFVLEARFEKIQGDRAIRLFSTYAPQYSAGGDTALIDGMRGGKDFRTGTWQGYEGQDLTAVVDLGKVKEVRHLSASFLQDNNAWIFMPVKVECYLSIDNKTFTLASSINNDIPHRGEGVIIKDFSAAVPSRRARYVKIIAYSIKTCPAWHKGAGNKCWIFADEIVIK
jgi:predicted alpha-1,2-mannosidase